MTEILPSEASVQKPPASEPEPADPHFDANAIRKANKYCMKKFGAPLVNAVPSTEVGLPGAPLAEVPTGQVAIVDPLTNQVIYEAEDVFEERRFLIQRLYCVPSDDTMVGEDAEEVEELKDETLRLELQRELVSMTMQDDVRETAPAKADDTTVGIIGEPLG